ncbi:carbon-nitrogen hydrolase [Meredithblackwellia eburnea MCA 4105]
MTKLNVACLQLSPVFKDAKASIERADQLLLKLPPELIDILVLPEMAFPGYCFDSHEDVLPFTEDPTDPNDRGCTFEWAVKTAKRLNTVVIVGFAQRSRPDPGAERQAFADDHHRPNVTLHNSLMVVLPTGHLHAIYQKHFLYTTDETWAKPGPRFSIMSLPLPLRNVTSCSPSNHRALPDDLSPPAPNRKHFSVALGICMDLNPHQFTSPFTAFEFANFVRSRSLKLKAESNGDATVDLVICCMAWLMSDDADDIETTTGRKDNWDKQRQTINYWATRLKPLIGEDTVFIAANRVGREKDVTFAGSSCVLRLSDLVLLDYASLDKEELLQVTIEIP